MSNASQQLTSEYLKKVISKENTKKPPREITFESDYLTSRFRTTDTPPGAVAEYIGSDNFSIEWSRRQYFEIDNGRLQEPLLYPAIYDVMTNSAFPAVVNLERLGPAGVVFERVEEGGEVKFASVTGSSISIPIYQYAVGIQYTKRLFMFNELWNLGLVEREAGIAYNALLNHVHLSPIINHSYGAANTTPASTSGTTLEEKVTRTIENAMVASVDDTTNPRYGPYVILCSSGSEFLIRRALTYVPQQSFSYQTPAILDNIQNIIVYNGWTGTRGIKETTYPGVTAPTCFLIDIGRRDRHFKSLWKQDLQMTMGNPDVSRFIMEQSVWDVWFGMYADPTGAVQKITLPTS
jgi:hypothetical protein